MTASQFFYGGNLIFINSFDTRFSCFFPSGTSLQSFLNLTLSLFVTETEVLREVVNENLKYQRGCQSGSLHLPTTDWRFKSPGYQRTYPFYSRSIVTKKCVAPFLTSHITQSSSFAHLLKEKAKLET